MGTLIDSPVFPAGVQHFEANAVLTGGPDCPDNLPLQDLANRTAWLKQQVESAQSGLAGHEVAADPHPQYLTTAEGDAAIAAAVAALVNSSPATLDTLAEFATALNNDPDFATTVSNAISAKVSKSDAQTQTYTAFTTTGAAGTFVLSPVPAITAYSVGKRFRAKFHTTGNGADTINISALGAKSLKQYDASGSKVAAVIASGQLADIEYDGVDVVILDPLPASTGTTPSQFDNSTKVATTGFIKSVGKSFSGVVSVGASATLDATYAGKLVLASSNGLVLTLPAASSYPSGAAISFLGGGGHQQIRFSVREPMRSTRTGLVAASLRSRSTTAIPSPWLAMARTAGMLQMGMRQLNTPGRSALRWQRTDSRCCLVA